MIVITLTSCPPKLRGDLSKWLCEINTGVYVGNLSARVRDGLRLRICENLDNGKATMVYSSNNEQKLEFRVHNGEWVPVDFDGITLMKRPLAKPSENEKTGKYYSKAGNLYRSAARRRANAKAAEVIVAKEVKKVEKAEKPEEAETAEAIKNQSGSESNSEVELEKFKQEKSKVSSCEYVVIDIETTGLQAANDEIIEIAALKIADGVEMDSFSSLVRTEKRLPVTITQLTGITQEMLDDQGKELQTALKDFLTFIGKNKIICHNLAFDFSFLQKACRKHGYSAINNRSEDTMKTARKKLDEVSDYKLATLASYFGLEEQRHRALDDCRLLFQVYEKILQK